MINYEFIGWNNDDDHDKVWGVIRLRTIDEYTAVYVSFWGRRSKKLSHKVFDSSRWDLNKLVSSKVDKGYREIYKDDINNVYPEFEKDLQKTAVWAMLKAH